MKSVWDEMRRMQEQMDSVFSNFFTTEPFWEKQNLQLENKSKGKDLAKTNFAQPLSDVWETDKEVVAEIDVPGVDKKDIKVNVTEDGIEVKAETNHEAEENKKGMYRFERRYSGFYRNFSLPKNVDANKAEAKYENGVLKIKVPKLKVEEKKKKLLEIK